MSTQTAPKSPSPIDGLQKFHADFLAFLYADHGDGYNTNVQKLETSTGTKREYMAYALLALNSVYMIVGGWAEFVCNLTGIAYPAYVSVKAIRTDDTADDTAWLIYWAVFATFALVDFFAMSIMSVFPFYWLLKASFLMYLYLPQTQGANVFYYGLVDPLVSAIDRALEPKPVAVPAVDENNNAVKPQ